MLSVSFWWVFLHNIWLLVITAAITSLFRVSVQGHRHEFPPRHCPWTVALISETMTSLH